MKKLLWMSVAFLLCSCNSFIPTYYAEPTDGDRARVRMVGGVSFAVIPKECLDWDPLGYGSGGKLFGRSLGMPSGRASAEKKAEFYVEAGKPISLNVYGFDHDTGRRVTECTATRCEQDTGYCWPVCDSYSDVPVYDRCQTTVTFIPKKDVDYEAIYSEESVSSCKIDVYPLGEHQHEQVKVTTPAKYCPIVKDKPALEAFAKEHYFLQTPAMIDPATAIPDEIKKKCDFGKNLGRVTLAKIQDKFGTIPSGSAPEQADDHTIIRLTITAATGFADTGWFGNKEVKARVDILKAGAIINSTVLYDSTRFKTGCAAFDRIAPSLGSDVMGWLWDISADQFPEPAP
ncbi:MAG: hypothetical protein LBV49_02105 [Azonexus sp.]|nr:hypothetical protein [Azonexus sp.]